VADGIPRQENDVVYSTVGDRDKGHPMAVRANEKKSSYEQWVSRAKSHRVE
jgi:hypothetical protein